MPFDQRLLPDNPLTFLKSCVQSGRVLWTYHVNMRLRGRGISRKAITQAVGEYEIIESYPDDKYLPSYLVYAKRDDEVFHILFALDVENQNVRVVTAYRPDPRFWSEDLKRRIEP